MTYNDALPYLQVIAVYTVGYLFGRHRGKTKAEAEAARLRKLADEALALARRRGVASVIR